MKAEKPTILGRGDFKPSAKCPNCNLIMYLGDECPHCEHLLSLSEQKDQKEFWIKTRNKSYLHGFIFFTLSILLLSFVFSI
ncbi:hypothetical protein ACLKMH_00120 [Psychromonas sp. KJ10-10]|uniref:hypothetical protein n=1 Tax=Psychromonas sp. KJ10-10 TaxID=3391823 RepID=UPI0039B5C6C0